MTSGSDSIFRCVKAIGASKSMMWCVALATLLWVVAALAEQPLPEVKRLETSLVLRHLKANPMKGAAGTPAERTVEEMYLPEGFRAELVVAEPDLHQPVAFAWDERGRMWVVEAYSVAGWIWVPGYPRMFK